MKQYFWQIIAVWCLAYSALSYSAESYKLTDFYAGDSMLRLEGQSAASTLSIPLSSTHKVKSASIHIEAVSSIALQENRSLLNVRFNNATIAQIPYSPQQPFINKTIVIPQSLWREGFNNVTFQVSQHYTNVCEDGSSPELWSEIDLYRSSLLIDTEHSVENLAIKHLSGLFSPGIGGQRKVTLANIHDDKQEVTTQALPLVAQGLALRNDYQPLIVTAASITPPSFPSLPDGLDWTEATKASYLKSSFYLDNKIEDAIHVVVATKSALQSYVTDATYSAIQGAYIGIETQAAVIVEENVIMPQSQRLIVSGTNSEEVTLAAKALATLNDELNPDSAITILEQTELSTSHFVSTRVLKPDYEYTFAETGSSENDFRGSGEFFKTVNLNLPADFYSPESAMVKVLLDFSYGAGMGLGSVMNISVNGKIVHGLSLDNPNGQAFNQYRLDLPVRYFKAGSNTMDFSIVLQSPQSVTDCHEIPDSHLAFQLHASSTIELPEAGKVAAQPDLALFADTTFPFTYATNDMPATIYYGQPDMLSAALTMAAKSAQASKTLNPNILLEAGVPQTLSTFALVLTRPADLNDDLFADYNTAVSNVKKWPYQLQNTLQNSVQTSLKETTDALMTVNGTTLQNSTLGDLGVLIMKENPSSSETGSVLIIAAETTDILTERVSELVSLNLWGQLAGDFFAWSSPEKPDLTMRVSSKFQLGETTSLWLELRMWLSNNPMYWILAVLALVIIASWLCYIALKARNKNIESSW
ncbi:cellulose biosynthesis cyclic di-GMP-binding regulatory protein BcsB [uncultured Paraglaciecola sp.]|uniref:cellulose biosynthesis cyclic di-GMP-binding regulatory protein BcsB n=1 Tax=uncultured Paraglaciecola sp. TaxID=1765024 RepID=UPI002593CEEF|nr:cellulose biosynthesis cyclic di-GMP-binding regulatory protein BcsB [uncultured Paraglaciecola sp.]